MTSATTMDIAQAVVRTLSLWNIAKLSLLRLALFWLSWGCWRVWMGYARSKSDLETPRFLCSSR